MYSFFSILTTLLHYGSFQFVMPAVGGVYKWYCLLHHQELGIAKRATTAAANDALAEEAKQSLSNSPDESMTASHSPLGHQYSLRSKRKEPIDPGSEIASQGKEQLLGICSDISSDATKENANDLGKEEELMAERDAKKCEGDEFLIVCPTIENGSPTVGNKPPPNQYSGSGRRNDIVTPRLNSVPPPTARPTPTQNATQVQQQQQSQQAPEAQTRPSVVSQPSSRNQAALQHQQQIATQICIEVQLQQRLRLELQRQMHLLGLLQRTAPQLQNQQPPLSECEVRSRIIPPAPFILSSVVSHFIFYKRAMLDAVLASEIRKREMSETETWRELDMAKRFNAK